MLSASARFVDLMGQAGVQPVYMVELHLDASTVKYFSTAFLSLADLDVPVYPSISDVVGVASSIDIESRAVSIGEFHVHFLDDGVFRGIVKDNFIYGKKVIVKLGCTDFVSYSDFLPVAVGVSRDVLPSEGEIDLECTDMLDILRNKTIGPRYWLNGHPLRVIEDILETTKIDSSLYDASTLSATSDLTRSHFLVSRYDVHTSAIDDPIISNGVNDSGESAQGLIDELCDLLWGSFAPDELGVFKFKNYDPTNAVDRNLSEHDTGAVEQLSAADPLYNKITMNVAKISRIAGIAASSRNANPFLGIVGGKGSREIAIGFGQQDSTSVANHNFLGNESGENDLEINTSWLCGPARIMSGYKQIGSNLVNEGSIFRPFVGDQTNYSVVYDHDAIMVHDAAYNGFCGCKFDLGTVPAASRVGHQVQYPHTFPVQANRDVTPERPSYLLLEGFAEQFITFGTVKTQPTIGDSNIELENVNGTVSSNWQTGTQGSYVIFGSDTNNAAGYVVDAWDAATKIITVTQLVGGSQGVRTAIPVGTPCVHITPGTLQGAAIPTEKLQWQTEVVKVTGVEAHEKYDPGFVHDELGHWPGGDGCLGPWSNSQPLSRSRDLAITCIGDNPTAAVNGVRYQWPYETLYNSRYPRHVRFRFEGTSGAFGTSPFGVSYFGRASSGRGQFGTGIPWGWAFNSTGNAYYSDSPDGLYYAKVWDITLLVDNVNRRLQRFKNGCPSMKIKTPLRHADLQLGDFITITTDIYSAYGRDGTDTGVVFEIISKTVDALADDPGCSFEIAWVRDDGVTYPESTYAYSSHVAQRGWQVSLNTMVYNFTAGEQTEPVLTLAGLEVTTNTSRS